MIFNHYVICLFLCKKETFFFFLPLYSQSLLFLDAFSIIVYLTVCLFTSRYSFNISTLLSETARTRPHDSRRGNRVTTRACNLISLHDGIDKEKDYYSAVLTQTRLPSNVMAILRMSFTPAERKTDSYCLSSIC